MKLVLKIALGLLLSAGSVSAQSFPSVEQTYTCLRAGVLTNDRFVACLKPLEAAIMANQDDEGYLMNLATASNEMSQSIVGKIRQNLPVAVRDRLFKQLNQAGTEFLGNCINYHINGAKAPQELALARCNMDSELFVLHFYFDNATSYWREGFRAK